MGCIFDLGAGLKKQKQNNASHLGVFQYTDEKCNNGKQEIVQQIFFLVLMIEFFNPNRESWTP